MEEYSREWRNKNPKKVRKMEEQWIENIVNHPKSIEEYYKTIRGGERKYNKTFKKNKEKYKNNLRYNINCKMSSLIWYSLKKNKKGNSWINIVGYNIDDLIKRLKITIPKGYNWEDFLNAKLQIDHIIPRSVFNFSKPEHVDFRRCWGLSNLQLLIAKENIIKSNKLNKPFQPALKLEIKD